MIARIIKIYFVVKEHQGYNIMQTKEIMKIESLRTIPRKTLKYNNDTAILSLR